LNRQVAEVNIDLSSQPVEHGQLSIYARDSARHGRLNRVRSVGNVRISRCEDPSRGGLPADQFPSGLTEAALECGTFSYYCRRQNQLLHRPRTSRLV